MSAVLQTPPSIDYRCSQCHKPVVDWSARVRPDTKLELVAECCGNRAEIVLYLGISGVLFSVDERTGTTLHLARR